MKVICHNKPEDLIRWRYTVEDVIQSERLRAFTEESITAYCIESAFCTYEEQVVGRLFGIISKTNKRLGNEEIPIDVRSALETSLLDFFCLLIAYGIKEREPIERLIVEIGKGVAFDTFLNRLDRSFYGCFSKGRLLEGVIELESSKSISLKS